MKKSNKYGKNIDNLLKRLKSINSLQCMFAIRDCVLFDVSDLSVIEELKKLKNSNLIEWNSCKISNCALAALHLLNVEPYQGNDGQVIDLIDTIFFTKT